MDMDKMKSKPKNKTIKRTVTDTDGKVRKIAYNIEEGWFRYEGYAGDFQTNKTTKLNMKNEIIEFTRDEQKAQDIIDEVIAEINEGVELE